MPYITCFKSIGNCIIMNTNTLVLKQRLTLECGHHLSWCHTYFVLELSNQTWIGLPIVAHLQNHICLLAFAKTFDGIL